MKTPYASVRAALRTSARGLFRAALRRAATRRIINALYARLTGSSQRVFHQRTRDLFRAGEEGIDDGVWLVRFADHVIRLPLRKATSWLDWDQAVSVLGHEVPIKETYQLFLQQPAKPDLFVDIGANYGTHSLLFLVCGVPVMTFEPNASCHDYFQAAGRLNGVTPRIEAVALGAETGQAELVFPPHDTWFGSVNTAVGERLKRVGGVETRIVPLRRLDHYVPAMAGKRVLMKIDVEGNELAILQGAEQLLETVRPIILFEAWRGENRAKIAELFERSRYRIASLPLQRGSPPRAHASQAFLESLDDDFIAIPAELLGPGGETDAGALFARRASPAEQRSVAV